MDLRHYTDQPMTLHRDRVYIQRSPNFIRKPEGFWVSVLGEDDWPTWCHAERFHTDMLAHEYKVTLKSCARIHHITNLFAFDAFHDTYSVETERRPHYNSDEYWRGQRPIDWRKVAADCDGIIIAPYQWERRMLPSWYYGWDCASGCIWNPAVIRELEGTKQVPLLLDQT